MSTATGEFAFNFATQSNQNPFSNSNFTALTNTSQISGGLLVPVSGNDFLIAYTGGTYDGGAVETAVEVHATETGGDGTVCGALDENGDGLVLLVRGANVIVIVFDNYAPVDSAASATITFTADDLFTFRLTKGTPNATFSATQNGSPITFGTSTYAITLSNLRSVTGSYGGSLTAIKSFAVVDGLVTGVVFDGIASGKATATSTLTTGIALADTARAIALPSSTLTTGITLAGTARGVASVSSSLNVGGSLAATSRATGLATSTLSTSISMSDAAQARALASTTFTTWTTVVLSAPLYAGTGGILDPAFWQGQRPTVGDTIYYDATHITIATTGEISSDTPRCEAVVQFNTGSSWQIGLVVFTPDLVSYATSRATTSSSLTTQSPSMASTAYAKAANSSTFTNAIRFAASSWAAAASVAALTTGIALQDTSNSKATSSSTLTTAIALQGAAQAYALPSSTLTTSISLSTSAYSKATVSATLINAGSMASLASAFGYTQSNLTNAIRFAGTAYSLSIASTALASQAVTFDGIARAAATSVSSLLTSTLFQSWSNARALGDATLATAIRLQAATQAKLSSIAQLSSAFLNADPRYTVKRLRPRVFTVFHRYKFGGLMSALRFPVKAPSESIPLTFDFTNDLSEGETLVAPPSVAITLTRGTDPALASVANGISTLDETSKQVVVPVKAGIDGCDYLVTVTCQTTNPIKTLTLAAKLPVRT